jgi:cyclopropane fatty-acyl-phospholipid synthase-like methyltransferase
MLMDPMLNRAPYDLIADQWTQERKLLPREKPYLEHFIALAIPGAHILDLGCGPGIMTRYLLDRGVRVTGVDSSLEMLRRAQVTCPEAEFIAGDMLTLKLTRRYQGIVAWDSVFHIPRTEHGRLFSDMYQWLEHNTPLLLSIGGSEDEFTAPMFGVDFFYTAILPMSAWHVCVMQGFKSFALRSTIPHHVAMLPFCVGSPRRLRVR